MGMFVTSHYLSRSVSCSWPCGEKAPPPRFRYLAALPCLLCLLIIWATPAWSYSVKRVLALHSYHQGYAWEVGVDKAVDRTFAQADFAVQVFHEHLDTLRLPNPSLQVAFFDHLRARYADAHLDLILASDNEALTFLLNYRNWLFGPIPVVFIGINGYEPAMLLGQRGYTGVAEQIDILSTLRAALDLRPQTRRVVVFGRLSMTYFENLKLLRAAVAKLGGGLQVVERTGHTLDSVLKEVAGLGEHDMVLLMEPVPDEQGQLVAFSRSTPLITQASSVPVYSLWDVVLGKGIVGGKMVSAAEQGRVGAEMALKILAGQDPASLPVVTESPNRYMFDYRQLDRFHMSLSALPRGSIVINQPDSLWDKHKAAILGLVGLLLLMSLTIGALAFAVHIRRRTEAALRKSEERFRSVVEQAADAIFVIDGEGRIQDVNQAACKCLGYMRDELLGQRISVVDTRVDQDRHREAFWEKLAQGKGFHFESHHRRKDGTLFPVEVSLGSLEVGGQKLMLALSRDITERKKAEEALHRLNRELKAISSCNQTMIRATDEKALLVDVCRIFCEEAGYRLTWVGYAENDEAKTVRPVAWAGHDDGFLAAAQVTWADKERGQGPVGRTIRNGKGASVQDFTTDPQVEPWRDAALQRGYRSELSLPLNDEKGKTFGALAIYSTEPNAFTTDEMRLLEDMAEDLAYGIIALRTRDARMMAEEELRRSDKRKTILNQIANIFLTVPDEEMYGEVLAVILRVMKSDFGIFGYLDEKEDLVIPSLTRDVWEECQVPEKSVVFPAHTWGDSLWGKAIRDKRAYYADAPFKTPAGHIAINNFLAVPVVFADRTIGLVSVANKQESYTETDKELLEGIVSSISPILNARLQRDIQERKRMQAEQALRESGERITALFNATTDSVILFDSQGSILAINEQGAQRRRKRREELEGKSVHEILPQATAIAREAKIREVAGSGQPVVFEEEWDGNSYFVSLFPVLDDKGEVRQIACFSRDVTKRKLAEDNLLRLNRELRAISECNQNLIRATDEQELLQAVCRIICDQAGYRMAWVGLAEDNEAKSVRPMAWHGTEDGYLTQVGISWADTVAGRGPTGTAIRTGQPCVISDFATDPQVEPWRGEALQRGYRSSIALPLLGGDRKAFGALNIYSTQPDAFTPEEVRLLGELGDDLAFGIVTLRARAQQELMNNVNSARVRLLQFAANHSLDDLLEETLNEAEALTGSQIGFYHFVEDDQKTLWLQNWSTRTKAKFCKAEGKGLHYGIAQAGVWVDCVHQRRPVIHNDYASLPHRKGLPPGHAEVVRELVVPVMRGDRIMAILGVGNKSRFYTQDDLEAVSLLADLAWEIAQRKAADEKVLNLARFPEEDPHPVLRLGLDGLVMYVNQPAQAILVAWQCQVGGAVPAEVVRILAEVCNSGRHQEKIVQCGKQTFSLTFTPVADATYLNVYGRDITDRLQAEAERYNLESQLRQAQKMEAIGNLAGGIAHDFNNILGAVMGFAELARDDAQAGKVPPRRDLDQIITAAERATELIKKIMAFGRKAELDLKPLNLNQVVQGTQAILERTLPKMISIETLLADDLPPILADFTQMEQVLLNLASNAADAMPDSGKLIIETRQIVFDHEYCRSHLEIKPGPYVLLLVTDTGVGMDQDILEHIFEPFYTTKEIGKGTGLGLASAYGIIKTHGGHIQCYSEVGMGTTFQINLPVFREMKIELKEEIAPLNEEALKGTETILLVDDEESLRQLGTLALRSKGYQVLTATRGEEALEIYRARGKQLDLVIMDLGMPGMGGHKAIKAIMEINPKAKVLIASGYSATTQVKAPLESGAAGYVAKPYKRADLLATVRSVLDKK